MVGSEDVGVERNYGRAEQVRALASGPFCSFPSFPAFHSLFPCLFVAFSFFLSNCFFLLFPFLFFDRLSPYFFNFWKFAKRKHAAKYHFSEELASGVDVVAIIRLRLLQSDR